MYPFLFIGWKCFSRDLDDLMITILDKRLQDAALMLYDPQKDRKRRRGGPCLSHVSLKVRDRKELLLTAVYRSHHYIERALGNLIGLSRLQAFICNETRLEPGPLVCVSTYAVLDTGSGHDGGSWGKPLVKALLASGTAPSRKVVAAV